MLNDSELITESIIPETGEKTARNYHFTDEECVIVSLIAFSFLQEIFYF